MALPSASTTRTTRTRLRGPVLLQPSGLYRYRGILGHRRRRAAVGAERPAQRGGSWRRSPRYRSRGQRGHGLQSARLGASLPSSGQGLWHFRSKPDPSGGTCARQRTAQLRQISWWRSQWRVLRARHPALARRRPFPNSSDIGSEPLPNEPRYIPEKANRLAMWCGRRWSTLVTPLKSCRWRPQWKGSEHRQLRLHSSAGTGGAGRFSMARLWRLRQGLAEWRCGL